MIVSQSRRVMSEHAPLINKTVNAVCFPTFTNANLSDVDFAKYEPPRYVRRITKVDAGCCNGDFRTMRHRVDQSSTTVVLYNPLPTILHATRDSCPLVILSSTVGEAGQLGSR
jgi:hypothetical protein